MDGTVLVADDDRAIRTVLTQALTRAGCKVHATSSLTTLMRWVGENRGDLVITDVMMPDGNGLEMLPKISQDRPELPVIVISAQNTIMTAIQAKEAEAYDYLPKPFDLPDLLKKSARALETHLKARIAPVDETPTADGLPLVGRTPVMQSLYKMIAGIVNSELPVMISGESGTGKSLVARTVHDLSDRRTLPFVTVNPSDLREMEGPARVLARAKGGTLVFDEIRDFAPELQARIIRMIDSPVDLAPRFIATTRAMDAGSSDALRDDLFFRLSGAELSMPSLRERIDDIPLLAAHFLKISAASGVTESHISEDAMTLLRKYSWPGNIRQLENTVQRLQLTANGPEITSLEVMDVLKHQPDAGPNMGNSMSETLSATIGRHVQRYFDLHGNMLPPAGLYGRILREMELPLIEIALDATGGNQAKCADLLGINRNTLRKKVNDLDIRVTRRRKLM